jgi:hypothetical protein
MSQELREHPSELIWCVLTGLYEEKVERYGLVGKSINVTLFQEHR